jgi:hypothetical protein
VLTAADLTRDLFGTKDDPVVSSFVSDYTGPSCSTIYRPFGLGELADALQAVGDASDEFDLDDNNAPTMATFFTRAADRLPNFDLLDSVHYQDTVDPEEEIEPHDAFHC